MHVTYEKKREMLFIGFHTEIRPGEIYRKCQEFWNREYDTRYARLWQTRKPETATEAAIIANRIGTYAICAASGQGFTYWIAGQYQGGDVPEGLKLFRFPAGNWAMFTAHGPLPSSLQNLNQFIWKEWYPAEGKQYQANGAATIEVYSAGDPCSQAYECGIWVPLNGAVGEP